MGKRKASELKTPVTKEVKREDTPDSDQEDEEYLHETYTTETDETKIDNSATTYEPDELRLLIESYLEFLSGQPHIPAVSYMEKSITEWVESRPDDMIDVGAFRADFRKHLKTATQVRNFQVNDAAATVLKFLSGEKALAEYKDYPVKAPTKIGEYIRRTNLTLKMGQLPEVFKMMRDDKSGIVEKIDEEIHAKVQNAVPDLRKFLDDHPNLTDAQKQAIEVKIKRIEKANQPKNGAGGATPRKKAKKQPETAYSIWCRTMTDKYRDLSEEQREKKLLKKFAKLPEGQRSLLESLALVH